MPIPKIKDSERWSTFIQPVIMLAVDYCSILLAECVAIEFREFILQTLGHTTRQIRLRSVFYFFLFCSFNFYCVSPLGPNLYSSPFHRRNDKKNFLVSSLFRCCLHRHFIFSRKGSGCIQTFCDFIRHVRIFFCLCRALSDEAPPKQVLIIFRTDNYDWFR